MTKPTIFVLLFALTNLSLVLLYPFSMRRFVVAAAIYVPGTLIMLYLLFHPRNQWLVPNRSWVDCGKSDGGQRRCVALTFDDGPNPVDTPKLLDILRAKNVSATFFVVGERAERYPEIVRREQAEGHLIGNHTWSHPSLFCFLTPGRLRSEIERGEDIVQRICGYRPQYFRSPVGLRHALLGPYLQAAGLEYISWRLRTWDTIGLSPETLTSHFLNSVQSGDIVLMHDHRDKGARVLLEILPGIIDELRRRGFEFVHAGTMPAGTMPAGAAPAQAKTAAYAK